MKKTLKAFMAVTSMVCVAAMSMNIFATEIEPLQNCDYAISAFQNVEVWEMRLSSEGFEYIGSDESEIMIAATFRPDGHGNLVEVELSKYLHLLNTNEWLGSLEKVDTPVFFAEGGYINPDAQSLRTYRFLETDSRSFLQDAPRRVSPFFNGPWSIIFLEESSVSHSFGGGVEHLQLLAQNTTAEC